jgi:hypothetical protein
MTGVLISFNLGSVALLIWVFIQGYGAGGATNGIRHHITLGLAATAMIVFSQSMTMMYAAAIGRMIRQAVEKSELDPHHVKRTKDYRKRIFRLGSLTMLIVMLHTILGGGAHTHVFPLRVHEVLAIITVLFTLYAVATEIRYLIYNHLLGHQVAEEFEAGRTNKA